MNKLNIGATLLIAFILQLQWEKITIEGSPKSDNIRTSEKRLQEKPEIKGNKRLKSLHKRDSLSNQLPRVKTPPIENGSVRASPTVSTNQQDLLERTAKPSNEIELITKIVNIFGMEYNSHQKIEPYLSKNLNILYGYEWTELPYFKEDLTVNFLLQKKNENLLLLRLYHQSQFNLGQRVLDAYEKINKVNSQDRRHIASAEIGFKIYIGDNGENNEKLFIIGTVTKFTDMSRLRDILYLIKTGLDGRALRMIFAQILEAIISLKKIGFAHLNIGINSFLINSATMEVVLTDLHYCIPNHLLMSPDIAQEIIFLTPEISLYHESTKHLHKLSPTEIKKLTPPQIDAINIWQYGLIILGFVDRTNNEEENSEIPYIQNVLGTIQNSALRKILENLLQSAPSRRLGCQQKNEKLSCDLELIKQAEFFTKHNYFLGEPVSWKKISDQRMLDGYYCTKMFPNTEIRNVSAEDDEFIKAIIDSMNLLEYHFQYKVAMHVASKVVKFNDFELFDWILHNKFVETVTFVIRNKKNMKKYLLTVTSKNEKCGGCCDIYVHQRLLAKLPENERRFIAKAELAFQVDLFINGITVQTLYVVIMEHFDLNLSLYYNPYGEFRFPMHRIIAAQLLEALGSLHKIKLIANLTPNNVFFVNDRLLFEAKLAIFTNSISEHITPDYLYSLEYASPEIVYNINRDDIWSYDAKRRKPLTSASDIFTFGLILAHLFEIKLFTETEPKRLEDRYRHLEKNPLTFSSNVPPLLQDLLRSILKYEPQSRLGCEEVLKKGVCNINQIKSHPFFAKADKHLGAAIDWTKLSDRKHLTSLMGNYELRIPFKAKVVHSAEHEAKIFDHISKAISLPKYESYQLQYYLNDKGVNTNELEIKKSDPIRNRFVVVNVSKHYVISLYSNADDGIREITAFLALSRMQGKDTFQFILKPLIAFQVDYYVKNEINYSKNGLLTEKDKHNNLAERISNYNTMRYPSDDRYLVAMLLEVLCTLNKAGIVLGDFSLDAFTLRLDSSSNLVGLKLSWLSQSSYDKLRVTRGAKQKYMPPEISEAKNTKIPRANTIDVWSYGICAYRILLGYFPIVTENDYEIAKIGKLVDSAADPVVKDFLQKLLVFNPSHRLGCDPKTNVCNPELIKQHPFFKSFSIYEAIEWDKLNDAKFVDGILRNYFTYS